METKELIELSKKIKQTRHDLNVCQSNLSTISNQLNELLFNKIKIKHFNILNDEMQEFYYDVFVLYDITGFYDENNRIVKNYNTIEYGTIFRITLNEKNEFLCNNEKFLKKKIIEKLQEKEEQ